ncbi:SGNH/GDSL hydrolase family protein [Roseivirga sp.]|uniref:SGNH/GDSL hydrolase family protein n=1 Tax=Roseivirga sp. TaxID=1964215 RepID=UPI003B8C820B
MNARYVFGVILAVPLLPLMYYQGKRIKKNIPRLPEAKGNSGRVNYPSDQTIRLLCLGESTMAGVGVNTQEEGLPGAISSELSQLLKANIEWKVYAKSGYTAKTLNQKLVPKIDETPDIIAISLGGNDAFTLNSPKKWKKDIQLLIDNLRIRFPHTPIVFMNMPIIKEFPAFTPAIRFVVGGLVEILGDVLTEVVAQNDGVYFSSEKMDLEVWSKRYNVKEDKSSFFSDGVHPAKLTYQVWGKDFARFIHRVVISKH